MYKKQLTFQRIICYLAVIAGALTFFYSLGMVTDLYDGLYWTQNRVSGADLYYKIQDFNRQLMYTGIGLLLLGVLLFLTQTQTRRRYYIGNYVSSGLYAVCAVGVSVWSFMNIHAAGGYKEQFITGVDFAMLEKMAGMYKQPVVTSTFWLDLQIALAILLIITAVLLIGNLIWKKSLMRAEACLIAEGNKSKQ